ncbi:hypothetical protein GQ54DRAFT_300795 [Martensiomyces pterosporus]|nr:hypothetical protein GQ54DRAFT_300795 [Martensiomyces pterosporus]
MKIVAILFALISTVLGDGSDDFNAPDGTVYSIGSARDSTVAYNAFKNSKGQYDALIPKGMEDTLVASKSDKDYERILLGFDLPDKITDPSQITNCVLHVPQPKDAPKQDYSLTAYAASSNWDEATVNADTKIMSIKQLTTTDVSKGSNPGDIDVTGACQAAAEGKFSMFVDSSGPSVSFDSIQSGKDTFSLDITY